jgi:hypothetical protein
MNEDINVHMQQAKPSQVLIGYPQHSIWYGHKEGQEAMKEEINRDRPAVYIFLR